MSVFCNNAYSPGIPKKSGIMRKISLALFLLTLCKVFYFDIHSIGTPYGILSFIVLGLILILGSNRASKGLQISNSTGENKEHD